MKRIILLSIALIFLVTGCGVITPPVDNEIIFRALLIGIGDYIGNDNDLASPAYSVDMMYQILNQCKFNLSDIGFSIINELKDSNATKLAILNGIASTFSGADDNDISYFYYTGHGHRSLGTSYLCPADDNSSISSLISVNKLESILSVIPGTKVVILDTCYSGGFIGKGEEEIIIFEEKLKSFNDDIVNIFSQAQSKGLLTTSQYKVLTSCNQYQECSEIILNDNYSYGAFTMVLCEGCGYFDYDYLADINGNAKVSLQELYLYIKDQVQYYFGNLEQDVQVYPDNSSYPIVEY